MATSKDSADVIVLGVGTCGEDLSLRLLGAGLRVIGVEASLVGGECAYWACLPSKAMIRASNAIQEARRATTMAGQFDVRPDWAPVSKRVREGVTGGWDDSYAVQRYESRGGRLIHGRGTITGPGSVTVGDTELKAEKGIVIATGSRPTIPPIPGLDTVAFWTTHDVIALKELPESLIVLGGGPIGCELGQVLSRFGVQVTVIEAGGRLLPLEEPEVSEALAAAFSDEGIGVRTGVRATGVRSGDGSIVVSLSGGEELSGERLLVATGRHVDLAGLGLASVGVTADRFIPVDENMRAADGIWAMGDVTGVAMFTHVALYQSGIVASDILNESHRPARYDALPRAVFTDPEIGAVGITEAQAVASGMDVEIVVKAIPSTFRGWLHMAGRGVIKLIADRKSGVLLGASACGPSAGELLGLLSFAVHMHSTLDDLRGMIYAFPTFYGGIGETIGAYARGLTTVIDPGFQGFRAAGSGGEAKR